MGISYFRLLSRSAVKMLLRTGPDFQLFLDRFSTLGGPVRRFPNGAFEIDQEAVGNALASALRSCATPGHEIEGCYVYQTLGPFIPKRYYCIQYPVAYQRKLRSEDSFQVGQGRIRPPASGEYALDHLEVTVGFRAKVGKAVRRQFVVAVSAWGATAAGRGAFDDGPISLASPGVEFSGTRARFFLDARRSGQNTLNWLALTMLDFGEDVHTVTGVYFGSTPEFLDGMLGSVQHDWEMVEFDANRSADPTRPIETERTGHVPPDAKTDSEFVSRSFQVLKLPVIEWDYFVATVYFGRSLLKEERKELTRLMDAWFLIGSCGGFGGRGTHKSVPVEFDDATDSVILRADMGDAEVDVALPVLVRTLEGFELGGAPIDAIVLGTRNPK